MEKEIVGAIVIREGKILLVNNHGNWSLPGGTREENESDVECLAREFSEEFSGTKIKNIRKYDEFCGVSPRNKNPIRVRAYLAEVDGKLRQPNGTDEDVKEYAWVDNFEQTRIAPVALEIINSLRAEGYFSRK